MRLAVITGSYPSANRPMEGSFVRQFVLALSRAGGDCVVIAPVSVVAPRNWPLVPRESREQAGGTVVRVLRPRYVSFSSRQLPGFNTALLTQRSFNGCVMRELHRLPCSPDVLYGHFLYSAGRAAVVAGIRLDRPSVVAFGESTFWSVEPTGFSTARRHFERVTGVLAVSSPGREVLIAHLGIPAEKIRVFPNGVDLSKFHARDRYAACRKFGLPSSTFNILFVGSFDDRKGVRRLLKAVEGLTSVRLVLVGRGSERVSSPNVAFQGSLDHDHVAEVLGAGDIFALPTTAEGSCNAIIEAMATGLPIVTSIGRYNDDIVDDDVAIRIAPMDVRAIREAIVALMNDPARRKSMSQACLEKSKQFDINLRARRVAAWLQEIVGQYDGRNRAVSAASGRQTGAG